MRRIGRVDSFSNKFTPPVRGRGSRPRRGIIPKLGRKLQLAYRIDFCTLAAGMLFGNLQGRLVVAAADGAVVDVERASDGRFGPDPQAVFAVWDDFAEWAAAGS